MVPFPWYTELFFNSLKFWPLTVMLAVGLFLAARSVAGPLRIPLWMAFALLAILLAFQLLFFLNASH